MEPSPGTYYLGYLVTVLLFLPGEGYLVKIVTHH